ncbi:DUF6053 domain-containing protein [Lysobacter capsici]|uniref:DUF6053 domain-containing protein n=1 Tax=Lysobacter capsici TaxID=435897 RepID=UPI00398C94CF
MRDVIPGPWRLGFRRSRGLRPERGPRPSPASAKPSARTRCGAATHRGATGLADAARGDAVDAIVARATVGGPSVPALFVQVAAARPDSVGAEAPPTSKEAQLVQVRTRYRARILT